MKNKIKEYTQLLGISGNEYAVCQRLKKTFSKGSTNIVYDNLGSIATTIPSKQNDAFKIGIFAHQDEVGLMIKKIEKDGIIKVVNVGGINVETLICQRVDYINNKNEKFVGIVMASSPHIGKSKIKGIDNIKLNFGFTSDKEAMDNGFSVGNYVNFRGEFEELTNNNVITKAADNRIGCAVVDELYETYYNKENNFELTIGATVQEEIGLKGAATLINKLNKDFDLILIVDVSPIDGMKEIKLGKGPLLRLAEPRGVYDVTGNQELEEMAKKLDIKVQNYFSKGRTDGAAMQVASSGYKTNALCVPAYNLHTNSTIFNLDDVNDIIKIIKGLLNEIN